jgi:hypothetical protein
VKATDEEIAVATARIVHPRTAMTMAAKRIAALPASNDSRIEDFCAEGVVARVVHGRLGEPMPGGIGHNCNGDVQYDNINGRTVILEVKTIRKPSHRFSMPRHLGEQTQCWHWGVLVVMSERFDYRAKGVVDIETWEKNKELFSHCPAPMYVLDDSFLKPFSALPRWK